MFSLFWMCCTGMDKTFCPDCDKATLIPLLHCYQYSFHSFICQRRGYTALIIPSQLRLHTFNYQSEDWHLRFLWSSCLQRCNYWASSTSLRCIDAAETTKLVSSITRLPFVNIIDMKWTLKCWLANLSTVQTKVAETFSFFSQRGIVQLSWNFPSSVSDSFLPFFFSSDVSWIVEGFIFIANFVSSDQSENCADIWTLSTLCVCRRPQTICLFAAFCWRLSVHCHRLLALHPFCSIFQKLLQGCGKCKQRHLNVKLSWKY